MSKKHRHRRRYEEELELAHRNNMLPENSPQGAGDPSLMFIGLLEMLSGQFNLFGNNEKNNNEDSDSSTNADERFEENVCNNYEEEEEILNNTTDDTIENDNYNTENNTNIIIQDVEYEVRENTVEDIGDNDIEDICNIEEIDEIEDIQDTDSMTYSENNVISVEDIDSEYNTKDIGNIDNMEDSDNVDDIDNINDIEVTANNVTVHCKAEVSNNTVLECCFSKNIKSEFRKEPVVSKVPVIISQMEIPIYIETIAKFKEPAFRIIDVNKDVFLESCHLINNSNKLFIKGFIRENIIYAALNCVEDYEVNGEVKSLDIDIPFKCTTKVSFNICPVLNNEVCCKMDSTNILETMIKEEIKILKDTLPETYAFTSLRKKIILNLRISLIQEQYVFISK